MCMRSDGISPIRPAQRYQRRWYFDMIAWVAALAVCGYPLAGLLSSFLGIADDSITVPFRIFVVALSGAALLQGATRAPLRTIDAPIGLFWLAYSFRLFWDAYVVEVPGADTALLYFAVIVLASVLALGMVANAWDERNSALCFLVVGGTVCAGSIYLLVGGAIDLTYHEESGRFGTDKVNPISLGHVGCTTVLMSIVLYSMPGGKLQKTFAVACAGLGFSLLYLAASRGPVICFVAAIGAY